MVANITRWCLSPLTENHDQMQQHVGNRSKDALKIDQVLEAMKCSGNTTMLNEAQSEERRMFEYEIEF